MLLNLICDIFCDIGKNNQSLLLFSKSFNSYIMAMYSILKIVVGTSAEQISNSKYDTHVSRRYLEGKLTPSLKFD